MKGLRTYLRMLGFARPYILLFVLTTVISAGVVAFDGLSMWFAGSLPKALFQPDQIAVPQPARVFASLETINQTLKFHTYRLIASMGRLNAVTVVCILIVVTFTMKNVMVYFSKIINAYLNIHMIRDMRNTFYRRVLLLPVTYHDRNRSGAIVSLLINDMSVVNASLMSSLQTLVTEPLRLVSFITLLFIINYKLTLMVFVIYPVLIWLIYNVGRIVKRRSKRVLDSFAGMIAIVSETVVGVRAVKMFNMNETESAKFEKENERFSRTAMRSERPKALLSPLTEILATVVTAALLWYGGSQAVSGAAGFSAEDFFRFIFILFASYQPLKALGGFNTTLQTGVAAAERVFTMMDEPVEPLLPPGAAKTPAFERCIELRNVTFRYPETAKDVLVDVSLTVRKGQVAAIVGSSGAGKSTLLDLLPRFYEITGGAVLIDGKDTREADLVGLRNLFGIVAQDTVLFNDTVRANIAYGRPDATEEQIRRAAEAANAMEFIEQLPQGLDTAIGERGVSLSGGQQQRLSIARAILRNAPILILDEATSSLDSESEQLVQRAINTLMAHRTAFVVAHRLSTIKHADCIFVLEQGRLAEQGTHDELIARGGRYKELYDIQFAGQEAPARKTGA